MNKNEIRKELYKVCEIIDQDQFIVFGDSARVVRQLLDSVDKITIAVTLKEDIQKLISRGHEFKETEDGVVCNFSGTVDIFDKSDPDIRPMETSMVDGWWKCQRFDVVSNPDLPWPWEPLSMASSIDRYKPTLRKWAQKNTLSTPDDIEDHINKVMEYIPVKYNYIKEWFISHKDKVRHIYDFSGLAFGFEVKCNSGRFDIRAPHSNTWSNDHLFKIDVWNGLSIIGKLNWMYDNCEFIPIRHI